MTSYDPTGEVDLIGHWVSQHGAELADDYGAIDAGKNGANVLRVPMAVMAEDTGAEDSPTKSADMSTRSPMRSAVPEGNLFGGDEIAAGSRALNAGSLRESALQ